MSIEADSLGKIALMKKKMMDGKNYGIQELLTEEENISISVAANIIF